MTQIPTTQMTVRPSTLPAYLPTVSPDAIEQALAIGDMAKMSPEVRVAYYVATCQSAGLNPMTRPFDLIKGDDGTIRLYPNKVAAEQLRKLYRVSNKVTERRTDTENGLFFVTVQASTPDGRQDEAQGIVDIAGKKGTALANSLMRAETKAKRRATLSLCGLGYEDSEDVSGHPVRFEYQQGEIIQASVAPLSQITTGAQASDDLFGDGAGDRMRKGHQQATPIATREDITEKEQQGPDRFDQIDATWRAYGLNQDQIDNYWQKTCNRYVGVSIREHVPYWCLPILLKEVERWIQGQAPHTHSQAPELEPEPAKETIGSAWRDNISKACVGVRDEETMEAVWDALNDPSTPDAIGEALLERVRVVAAQVAAL